MIRRRFPDKVKALSMLSAATNNIISVELLVGNDKAGGLIISAIYESFRMLGDALLTAEGFETSGKDHHADMIGRLLKLHVTSDRPLLVIDELRKKRNNINYEGYMPTPDEVKDAVSIKNSLWNSLLSEVMRLIEQ